VHWEHEIRAFIVRNRCWERKGSARDVSRLSPRSVGPISLQHHKSCLAPLLVQGHPVERKKFYISAGSGYRPADKVVSTARQRTSMSRFKDFQNPTGSKVPHTHTQSRTVFNLFRYFIHDIRLIWTFQTLAVTLRTTRFNIQQFDIVLALRLCVLHGSQKKQKRLPCTAPTDLFFL
jgi:hypothetical protein